VIGQGSDGPAKTDASGWNPPWASLPWLIKEIFDIITRLNKEEKIPLLLVEPERQAGPHGGALCLWS